jgi:hypothetical protein
MTEQGSSHNQKQLSHLGIEKRRFSGRKKAFKSNSGVNKNLLILHFTVFIWGFTGILGQLISISAVNLVWYRVLIASISLFLYFKFNKTAFKVSPKTW